MTEWLKMDFKHNFKLLEKKALVLLLLVLFT